MKEFPAITVPQIDFVKKIFESMPDGEKVTFIKRKWGKKHTSEALAILKYFGYVEGKGVGRNRRYYKKRSEFDLEKDYIKDERIRAFLYLLLKGSKNRSELVKELYGNKKESKSTKMKRITAMASLGRRLGFLKRGRVYKLSDEGRREVFRYVLEKAYKKLREKSPISYVPISEVRRIFMNETGVKRDIFDETVLKMNDSGDIHLTKGPVTSEEDVKEGISSVDGVYQHLRIDDLKYFD